MKRVVLTLLLSALAVTFDTVVKDWDYHLLNVEFKSTNHTLTDTAGNVRPVRRAVYAMTAYHFLHKDILDEHLMFELKCYYNVRHNNNFELWPFHVSYMDVLSYVNTFYKKYFMKSLKDCSSAPQFEGNLTSWQELAKNFTFKNCQIDLNDLPNYMRPGFYMIVGIQNRTAPPYVNSTYAFNVQVEKVVLRKNYNIKN